MQLKRKILSHFLLLLYLSVVLHHNIKDCTSCLNHDYSIPSTAQELRITLHHDNCYKIGFLHFFQHFIEFADQAKEVPHDHSIAILNIFGEKNVNGDPTSLECCLQEIRNFSVFAKNVRSKSCFYLSLLEEFIETQTSPRGSPIAV